MFKDFNYITDDNSKALILGTFPSKMSRQAYQYYGNKHNQFWKILFNIFGQNYSDDISYDHKVQFLLDHNIALWDIIASCDTDGSLDSRIKNAKYNDINGLLKRHKGIHTIFCNGQMAYKYIMKIVNSSVYDIVLLPSSSPTNTMKYQEKFEVWKEAFNKN